MQGRTCIGEFGDGRNTAATNLHCVVYCLDTEFRRVVFSGRGRISAVDGKLELAVILDGERELPLIRGNTTRDQFWKIRLHHRGTGAGVHRGHA